MHTHTHTHTQVLSNMASWCSHTEKITLHGEGGLPHVTPAPILLRIESLPFPLPFLPSSLSSSLLKGLMPAMASCGEDLQSYIGRTRCVCGGGRRGGSVHHHPPQHTYHTYHTRTHTHARTHACAHTHTHTPLGAHWRQHCPLCWQYVGVTPSPPSPSQSVTS